MKFLDTDVMIDILRGYKPALAWLNSLGNEEVGLCGIVVMELVQGCRNQQEVVTLDNFLASYTIYWPTAIDGHRALNDLANHYLSQGLKMLDALIGECAVGLKVALHTFNRKHFSSIKSLTIVEPYVKHSPPQPAGS